MQLDYKKLTFTISWINKPFKTSAGFKFDETELLCSNTITSLYDGVNIMECNSLLRNLHTHSNADL